jgi:hypothetical protein
VIVCIAKPRENGDVRCANELFQQFRVRAADDIALFWRHQRHASVAGNERWQGRERESYLIHDTELVFCDDDHVRAHCGYEFPRTETFSQRAQQSAGALHQNCFKVLRDLMHVGHDFSQLYTFAFLARREQRRERGTKVPRVDFIQCERTSESTLQRANVIAPARANRFQCCDIAAARAAMGREQCSENGLTYARVGAGDDDDATHSGDEIRRRNSKRASVKQPRRLVRRRALVA